MNNNITNLSVEDQNKTAEKHTVKARLKSAKTKSGKLIELDQKEAASNLLNEAKPNHHNEFYSMDGNNMQIGIEATAEESNWNFYGLGDYWTTHQHEIGIEQQNVDVFAAGSGGSNSSSMDDGFSSGCGPINKKRGCFPKNATNKLKHWLFLNVTVCILLFANLCCALCFNTLFLFVRVG